LRRDYDAGRHRYAAAYLDPPGYPLTVKVALRR
jgi:hypothetical protein